MIDTILFIAGAVCFTLAAFDLVKINVNLIALGLLFWILTNLI